MEFFRRAAGCPGRLGILPGTFHPPSCAHFALGLAALRVVEEVVFVLPRELPHKRYEQVGFDGRMRMLLAAVRGESRFSVAASGGGLFIEIARECRDAYGFGTQLSIVCGRDAAERIVNWDYGSPGAILGMLREFDLLVASRSGDYAAPPELRPYIHPLPLESSFDLVSATDVRRRIAAGESWEHLVPSAVVPLARELYAS